MGRTLGCALDDSGFVWVWGSNADGELGLDDTVPRDLPAPVVALKNRKISHVQAGGASIVTLGKTVPLVKKP